MPSRQEEIQALQAKIDALNEELSAFREDGGGASGAPRATSPSAPGVTQPPGVVSAQSPIAPPAERETSPFSGISALREEPLAPGAPRATDIVRREALADRVATTAPPGFTLGAQTSAADLLAAEQIASARHKLGLGPEFTTPEASPFFVRALQRAANTLNPTLGALVPDAQAATFRNVTLEQIHNDPALLDRWDGLTRQERAFVLLDGTNKAADLLGAPQAVYERLFGGSAIVKHGDKLYREHTEGIATSGLDSARTGAPPPGQVTAATPAGIPAGSVALEEVADLGVKSEYIWTRDDLPGISRGQSFMLTESEAARIMREAPGSIEASTAKPHETAMFMDKSLAEAGVVMAHQRTNRQFRSMSPEQQRNLIRLSGDFVNAVYPDGSIRSVPEEMFLFNNQLRREGERGPKSVIDTRTGVQGFATDQDIANAPYGAFKAAPQEQHQRVTQAVVEREADSRTALLMTGLQVQRLLRVGERGLAFPGKLGNFIGKVLRLGGADEAGQAFANWASGGQLSLEDRGALRKELVAWVTSRKKAILNDQRLSDRDVQILLDTVSLAENFANPEEVLKVIGDMTMLELVNDELNRYYGGRPLQYNVSSNAAAAQTMEKIFDKRVTAQMAAQAVWGMSQYWELNSRLPAPAGVTRRRDAGR